jgi:hypothetical protein
MVYISKCHRGSLRYPTIKKWFLKEYPDVAKFGIVEVPDEAQNEDKSDETNNQNVISNLIIMLADVLSKGTTLVGLMVILITLGPVLLIVLVVGIVLALLIYAGLAGTQMKFMQELIPINRRFGYFVNLAMGKEAIKLDAGTFQFFTRNPRGGSAKPLNLKDIEAFEEYRKENGYGNSRRSLRKPSGKKRRPQGIRERKRRPGQRSRERGREPRAGAQLVGQS